jgi:hypothetical protein
MKSITSLANDWLNAEQLVPALLWAIPKFGIIGAAWVWALLYLGYILIGVQWMYRRIFDRPEEVD